MNANDLFFDEVLRHQIGLRRVEGSIRNRIIALLDATESHLRGEIAKRLQALVVEGGISFTPIELRRLQVLEEFIATTRGRAFVLAFKEWRSSFAEIAVAEPGFMIDAMNASLPVTINYAVPAVEQLTALVTTNPFRGKVLRDWAKDIGRADIARINAEIRMGLAEGQTIDIISRRVFGTLADRGTSGVTEITRRQATAITRTAVTHYSNKAKELFFLENKDIIKREIYTATLDGRTTPICQSLDGKVFPVGEGARPPMHFQCRSVRLALLDKNLLGSRPSNPATEKRLLREFTAQENLKVVRSRKLLPHGTKGRFDAFSRTRKRELIGTVPAKVTYQQWLGRQPVHVQNDILGVTKGKLFRKGGLTLDRFVDRRGTELTLVQLKKRNPLAFVEAGIN